MSMCVCDLRPTALAPEFSQLTLDIEQRELRTEISIQIDMLDMSHSY